MRPIVINVVCLSVCLSVTIVSSAKTAELIEMPFGLYRRGWTKGTMCYMGVQISHGKG